MPPRGQTWKTCAVEEASHSRPYLCDSSYTKYPEWANLEAEVAARATEGKGECEGAWHCLWGWRRCSNTAVVMDIHFSCDR